MTAAVFQTTPHLRPMHNVITSRSLISGVLSFLGYTSIFIGYGFILIVALLTVGFLEIRQANMVDFNALIAALDQRDRYAEEHYIDNAIHELQARCEEYKTQLNSFTCYDIRATKIGNKYPRTTEPVVLNHSDGTETPNPVPRTCAEIKQSLQRHLNELSLAEDELRFSAANLAVYYAQYEDGIAQKTPQIIPALQLLELKSHFVTAWSRSPFELVEMFLLVLMGLLGGVISVMQCLIRNSSKRPSISECFYAPAAGAAISLGVYVLFRAAQLFLGVQNQNGAGSVSTSIFLLAGLGLASGFCASEALGVIESIASKLLRTSGGDIRHCISSDTGDAQRTKDAASISGHTTERHDK